MRENLRGRVEINTRLGKKRGLRALFEAIINSIDAIQYSARGINEGHITVTILRHKSISFEQENEEAVPGKIFGFEIQDNGIGFTSANYDAFNEADTRYKAALGGKGVGRFIWLKVFEKAKIESTFTENESLHYRSFVFSLANEDGIGEYKQKPSSDIDEERTVVTLINLRKRYSKGIPETPETIAEQIVQHCLEYFVLENMPNIALIDEHFGYNMQLQQVYNSMVSSSQKETIEINSNSLELIHFMLNPRPRLKHQITYCANGRAVSSISLESRIPHLAPRLTKENGSDGFVYASYVSSKYLDSQVNPERTGFYSALDSGLDFPGELAWVDIEEAVLIATRKFLHPYTEKVRVKTLEVVKDYVNKKAPQYKSLINNHPSIIDTIPPNKSTAEIDTKLHEAQRNKEIELRKSTETILDKEIFTEQGDLIPEKWRDFVKKFSETNAIGKANLAKYILHRRWMLWILEKAIRIRKDGHYSSEDLIHETIFPIRSDSDEVSYEDHNLWILDEKLAYHDYLASDKQLSQMKVLDSKSPKRPDLAIFFSSAIATSDERPPFRSGVVIFEFKRPLRDDYTPQENPVLQVKRYVKEIRSGNAKDKYGRIMKFPSETPFHCYIICDITKNLSAAAEMEDLQVIPDGEGYIGYHSHLSAFIQIISFDRLLEDANKRNLFLFDKLALPSRIELLDLNKNL